MFPSPDEATPQTQRKALGQSNADGNADQNQVVSKEVHTMTDTTVANEAPKMLKIQIRAKCGELEFNPDDLPINAYEYCLALGVETFVNKQGMSKKATGITKLTGHAREEAEKAVVEQAKQNLQDLKDGKIKVKGASKIKGAVQAEAMRLAKTQVKELLKANGYKVSGFSAKELTDFAKDVLAANPDLLKKAEANLAERAVTPVKGIDLKKMLGVKADDPTVKAKPKTPPKPKSKKDKVPLSAAEAGKVAPRAKPTTATAH